MTTTTRTLAAVALAAALTAMPAVAHAATAPAPPSTDSTTVVLETRGPDGRTLEFEPAFDGEVVALAAAPVQDALSCSHLTSLVAGERYEADGRLYRRNPDGIDLVAVRTPEGVVGLVDAAAVAPLVQAPDSASLTRAVLRPTVQETRGLWAIAAGGLEGDPVVRVMPHGAAPEVGTLDSVAVTDGVTVTGSAGKQGLLSSGPSTVPWRYVETIDGELAGWVAATTVVTAPTYDDACQAPRTVGVVESGALLAAPDVDAEQVRTVQAGARVQAADDLLRGWLTVCDARTEQVVWLATDAPVAEAPTAAPTSPGDAIDDLVDDIVGEPTDEPAPTEPAEPEQPTKKQLPVPLAAAGLGVLLLAGTGLVVRARRARSTTPAPAMDAGMNAAALDDLNRPGFSGGSVLPTARAAGR
jgi:hypothetical protein